MDVMDDLAPWGTEWQREQQAQPFAAMDSYADDHGIPCQFDCSACDALAAAWSE